MTNTFEQLKMEFSVDKKQMLRRENVSNIEMYLILLNNTFEQLKQLKKNSQLTRNRCRGEKMYSCLGEYWEEALAYIVILAYFLRGGTRNINNRRESFKFPHFCCAPEMFKNMILGRKISVLGMAWSLVITRTYIKSQSEFDQSRMSLRPLSQLFARSSEKLPDLRKNFVSLYSTYRCLVSIHSMPR